MEENGNDISHTIAARNPHAVPTKGFLKSIHNRAASSLNRYVPADDTSYVRESKGSSGEGGDEESLLSTLLGGLKSLVSREPATAAKSGTTATASAVAEGEDRAEKSASDTAAKAVADPPGGTVVAEAASEDPKVSKEEQETFKNNALKYFGGNEIVFSEWKKEDGRISALIEIDPAAHFVFEVDENNNKRMHSPPGSAPASSFIDLTRMWIGTYFWKDENLSVEVNTILRDDKQLPSEVNSAIYLITFYNKIHWNSENFQKIQNIKRPYPDGVRKPTSIVDLHKDSTAEATVIEDWNSLGLFMYASGGERVLMEWGDPDADGTYSLVASNAMVPVVVGDGAVDSLGSSGGNTLNESESEATETNIVTIMGRLEKEGILPVGNTLILDGKIKILTMQQYGANAVTKVADLFEATGETETAEFLKGNADAVGGGEDYG